jgi:hypothetical protein
VIAPLVYLLYLQLTGAKADITFNQLESYGVQYTTPVQTMLLGLQERASTTRPV